MKTCVSPLLVGLGHFLPSDPSVAYAGGEPHVGCNRLVCSACNAAVRHVDRRRVTSHHPPPRAELTRLHESKDPAASPLLEATPHARTYLCRCDWYTAGIGPPIHVSRLDQSWYCAGHGAGLLDARDLGAGTAHEAIDVLTPATVPMAVPATGAKIRLCWSRDVEPAFASASELRDSLLASYPEAEETGLPLVRVNREDTLPSWGWVAELVRTRRDWWPALGIALQHAATEGGEIAQTALAELLAHFPESVVLLPWTAPMAELWPGRRTIHSAATGWGTPEYRLDALVRDQSHFLSVVGGSRTAFLVGYGVGGEPIEGPLSNEAELLALLRESARVGRSPGGHTGPWSWVTFRTLIGDDWLREGLERIIDTIDHDDHAMVFAMLDWFFEEQDLWRFVRLLDGWRAHPPDWWAIPAHTTPTGWQRNMRSAHWPNVHTLGDVAIEVLRRASSQLATPPVVDLSKLYGSSDLLIAG